MKKKKWLLIFVMVVSIVVGKGIMGWIGGDLGFIAGSVFLSIPAHKIICGLKDGEKIS